MAILAAILVFLMVGLGILGFFAGGRYIAAMSSATPLTKDAKGSLESAMTMIFVLEIVLFIVLWSGFVSSVPK